jgi:hypothetical protein
MLETLKFIQSITTYARAAFHLAIAESLWSLFENHPWVEKRNIVRGALDTCWDWCEGKPIDYCNLYDAHGSDEKPNIYSKLYEETDQSNVDAWIAIDGAITYVIWKELAICKDQDWLPADIENMTEECILESINYAKKVPGWSESQFDPLKKHLLVNYPSTNPDELGSPITREEVIAHLPH